MSLKMVTHCGEFNNMLQTSSLSFMVGAAITNLCYGILQKNLNLNWDLPGLDNNFDQAGKMAMVVIVTSIYQHSVGLQ